MSAVRSATKWPRTRWHGRQLLAQGHAVRLMSPEYVRPYVKAQKNDERDAEAIAEAATQPTMLTTIRRDHIVDLVIGNRRPFAIDFDFVMIAAPYPRR
jgi:transposase